MSTQLQPSNIIVYIDNNTGQLYVETGDRLYELELASDVTEEMELRASDLEILKVFDPADTVEPVRDGDMFKLLDDDYREV